MDKSKSSDCDRESTPDVEPFIVEKLTGCIFSAWYTDRIWIDQLKNYRDQVKIDEDEIQTIRLLKSVHRKVKKQIIGGFTGIEKSNDQVSIFVDWSKNPQVIGHYWFIIERAYLGTPNVIFQLRILRPVSGSEKSSGRCPHCHKLPIQESTSTSSDDPLNISEIARQLQWKFRDIISPSDWWTDARPHLNLENVFKFGKFLIVLLLAAVSGLGQFLIYALSHTNRFVFNLSGLMKSATPFLLAIVDAFNRLFAGVFTLIAMMWKDYRRGQETPRGALNRLAYEKNDAKKKYLEGPPPSNYPYERREVNRPYMKTD